MQKMKRWNLVALIVVLCVAVDQLTKAIARLYLSNSPPHSFLGDTFRLQFSENPGAFLNLGASLPPEVRFWVFTLSVGGILTGLLFYILKANNLDRPSTIGLSLVLGGGVGNLIDRIVFDGVVTDFLNVGIGALRTGIFNVADVVIMLGAGLMIWQSFIDRKQTDALSPRP